MIWIAPSEKDTANGTLEKRLWDSGEQFRANSGLKPQEYSAPVLGLILVRFGPVSQRKNPVHPLRQVAGGFHVGGLNNLPRCRSSRNITTA
jgi:hypothetical protein